MRIGKAAKSAGVSVETIRFYERRGLISQPSRPIDGGFRSYPSETVGRIRFIRQAQLLGFSLKETDELLSPSSHYSVPKTRDVSFLTGIFTADRAIESNLKKS